MRTYRIAPMRIDQYNVIAVWISRQYIGNEEDIEKSIRYFSNLFGTEEIIVVMVDENEKPYYHGRQEIVDQFDHHTFRKFPWQEYVVEETQD